MSVKPVTSVIVVGGGAAGWLTAGLLGAMCQRDERQLSITVVESPDVKTIGVGEGTWPTMRRTLATIGLEEDAFLSACHATFKQGSKFVGWQNNDGAEAYYHPFTVPEKVGQADWFNAWKHNGNTTSFAEYACAQVALCEQGKAPKQLQTPAYAGVQNYAYHLDANAFVEMLRSHCTQSLGVSHLSAHIHHIHTHENGIAGLDTSAGALQADLYVDCSGMQSLLLGKALGVGWQSLSHILFNNRALAAQIPTAHDRPIPTCTHSTATDNGWIWDIPLTMRHGVGHVYSDAFTTNSSAEVALRDYIATTFYEGDRDHIDMRTCDIRQLTFEPGHRKVFWEKNCVAIGMSAGFIEPLEASALAMVELSANMLCDNFPADTALMPIIATKFNRRFLYRWERIVDFLKLHYVLSKRTSDYWLAHRDARSIPQTLREQLMIWQQQSPSHYDFVDVEEVFPSASYQYILYGMGFVASKSLKGHAINNIDTATREAIALHQHMQSLIARQLSGLPEHRQLLNQMVERFQRSASAA
ncbi:tryptophan 7-halogenase [Aestuariibacter sp. AA17]|uniref:Tryptophan 7-halogenase n=1 Tax=Fluctibacter corallii TaxID=2984329 RepID=A0ABT3A763_9ALTE|nr:tryptophan halogenase family protein [Aestuariibacter sp. AA17]MCV2884516.1 tryptophan 7-halogenase [Aestuariibacter sp. AA17]